MTRMTFHFLPSNDADFDVCGDTPPAPAAEPAPARPAPAAPAPSHPLSSTDTAEG